MKCGLLGRKLSHSYSPQIHSFFGDYAYDLSEKEPEDLQAFFQAFDLNGINVTIPYKKDVLAYCDTLTDIAKTLGSVNTIVKLPDGRLLGHNSDYFGFMYMVKESGLQVNGKKVLVLGSGGASVTVVAVLKALGALPVVISRTGKDNYSNLSIHKNAAVIVNTTPVGMYPNNGESPVDLDQFPALEGILDLIYNPARTALIMQAENKGLVAKNGLTMLVAQAKESAELFTGCAIDDSIIDIVCKSLRRQMENIILIGMPGCGKSSIGQALAERLGKTFVDTDRCIEHENGKTISQIFAEIAESGFRDLETKAISDIAKQSGLIIATGGGCVTQDRNYPLLHQNGRIIYIQRPIEALPTDGRPLSQNMCLLQMFQKRKASYERFADYTVTNEKTVDDAVKAILSMEESL